MSTFKIFHELFVNGTSTGQAIVCASFQTKHAAQSYARNLLKQFTGYITIHKYQTNPAIIGGTNDNGTIVDTIHNCMQTRIVMHTDKNALKNSNQIYGNFHMSRTLNMPIANMTCIHKDTDNHTLTFDVVIGCSDTPLHRQKLANCLMDTDMSFTNN